MIFYFRRELGARSFIAKWLERPFTWEIVCTGTLA